jgi:ElaB/YqjD/DUF883 family membrane-anchored ribosome-binding protein
MSSGIQDKIGKVDAMAQIGHLREEVETLMRDKVTPAVAGATERMVSTAQNAADTIRTRADMFAGSVRHQPLISILLAAGVGYLLGRVAR